MADLTTTLGVGTTLPVVAIGDVDVDGVPTDRGSRRLLRRASRILAALRAAEVHGTATIHADGGTVLGLRSIRVRVRTSEDAQFVVLADTYPRGGVSGPAGESVRVAVLERPDGRPGLPMRTGSVWVDIDRGPSATRSDLLGALRSALAPQVWAAVTGEMARGQRVDLYRAEPNGGSGLVVDTTGPAGHVVGHVDWGGHVGELTQRTGSSWSRGEGAFGRFLTAEFRRSLDVQHEREVFGPFMERLTSTARAYSGLPAGEAEG
ncbi:hypothetical protein N866_03205 [Actinotalea ferrariae CF5-4]|uniref:Uncharacterized protein n=1 Tax=Actinotalea ferrariae CF5-4 TaxID=948458 RepID=A0A021VUT4_9CELL|nr:hypothetical protein [Actinotalea ferrariae]EYR64868.1 hypothetical protein N866_03205 [Actinotalea ferrariae CF5-4]